MSEPETCPECGGKKTLETPHGDVDCFLCDGTGTVVRVGDE